MVLFIAALRFLWYGVVAKIIPEQVRRSLCRLPVLEHQFHRNCVKLSIFLGVAGALTRDGFGAKEFHFYNLTENVVDEVLGLLRGEELPSLAAILLRRLKVTLPEIVVGFTASLTDLWKSSSLVGLGLPERSLVSLSALFLIPDSSCAGPGLGPEVVGGPCSYLPLSTRHWYYLRAVG
jgi:hypothetical protein